MPLNCRPGLSITALPGNFGGGARGARSGAAPALSVFVRPPWLLDGSVIPCELDCDTRELLTLGIMMPDGNSFNAASPGVSTSKSSISSGCSPARDSLRRVRSADAVELMPGSGRWRCAPLSAVRLEPGPGRCAMKLRKMKLMKPVCHTLIKRAWL